MGKELLLSVCKFVDTALLLLPQTFQLFKWSFIQVPDASNKLCTFEPHLKLLTNRLERQRKNENEKEEETKEEEQKQFGIGWNESESKKRPILLMRTIKNVYELIPFHQIISSIHQRQSKIIDIDYKFLDDLIRSDFIVDSE